MPISRFKIARVAMYIQMQGCVDVSCAATETVFMSVGHDAAKGHDGVSGLVRVGSKLRDRIVSVAHALSEGCFDVLGQCCHEKPCGGLLTIKGRSSTFAVASMISDS